jgi:predicted DNA-binding transcriptional regulator AlpA
MQKQAENNTTSRWVNAKNGAEHLDLPLSSYYQLIQIGKLPSPVKLGNRSRWRIADLDSAMLAMVEAA